MYPSITYELLKSKKACEPQLALVKEVFGLEPIPLTTDTANKFAFLFNIHWLSEVFLTNEDQVEYNRSLDSVKSEYCNVNNCIMSLQEVSHIRMSIDYRAFFAREFVRLYTRGANVNRF